MTGTGLAEDITDARHTLLAQQRRLDWLQAHAHDQHEKGMPDLAAHVWREVERVRAAIVEQRRQLNHFQRRRSHTSIARR